MAKLSYYTVLVKKNSQEVLLLKNKINPELAILYGIVVLEEDVKRENRDLHIERTEEKLKKPGPNISVNFSSVGHRLELLNLTLVSAVRRSWIKMTFTDSPTLKLFYDSDTKFRHVKLWFFQHHCCANL